MIEVERDDIATLEKDTNTESNKSTTNWKLKKTLTFNEIMCTAMMFLSAGYETTATTLCFVAHSLAMNPDCQEKLIEEIDRVLEKHVNFVIQKTALITRVDLLAKHVYILGW